MEPYVGPHPIVDRPSDSTIKVKVGTFKSGVKNVQLHHWSNAKPADLRDNFTEAEMPLRGRPPKKVDSPGGSAPSAKSDTPFHQDSQSNTEASGPASQQNGGKVNKPASPRANTSNQPVDDKAGNSKRPVRSTRNPEPLYVDAVNGPPPFKGFPKYRTWSASASELASINSSIETRRT